MSSSLPSTYFSNKFKIIAVILTTALIKFSMGSILFLQTNFATMNGVASNVYGMHAISSNQFVMMNSISTPAFEMVITTLNSTATTFGFVSSATSLTYANLSTYVRTT